MNYRKADDAALLVAAGGRDWRAFEEFYRRWLPSVTSYFLRRTGVREVAFDLTAETFVTIAASCDRFDPQRGGAAVWLFTVAENKLIDSIRRMRVESSTRTRLRLEPVRVADRDLELVDQLASSGDSDMERLLARLPADQREAVRARVLDERSYAELAAEMSCSEAVVRQRVSRGLGRLRSRLKETA
ncbi:MAG: sigma-70 family RNA polymerase sigma factor [Solirubrobacterales bacterium]|nr:sigma-70 family RNA polymerase sigma factor [Solirubrobacterales bacterium]